MNVVLKNISALLPLTSNINEKLVSVDVLTVTLLDYLKREQIIHSVTTKPVSQIVDLAMLIISQKLYPSWSPISNPKSQSKTFVERQTTSQPAFDIDYPDQPTIRENWTFNEPTG